MSKIAQIRQEMRSSGEFFAGPDPWPTGARHILVLGSKSSKLHLGSTASYLQGLLGGSVTPLIQNPNAPNLYYFAVEIAGAPKLAAIEALEGEVFLIAAVYRHPLLSDTQTLWTLNQLRGSSSGIPEFWPRNRTVAPGEWIWLQVKYQKMAAQSASRVCDLLEAQGYETVNPVSGVSGFFERTFWRDDYVGPDYVNILFSPADRTGVSADALQAEIFDKVGGPDASATVWFFTTPELKTNQGKADTMRTTKRAEGAAGDVVEGIIDALARLMSILEKTVRIVPTVTWLALVGAAAFGGYKLYGYATRKRKKR